MPACYGKQSWLFAALSIIDGVNDMGKKHAPAAPNPKAADTSPGMFALPGPDTSWELNQAAADVDTQVAATSLPHAGHEDHKRISQRNQANVLLHCTRGSTPPSRVITLQDSNPSV
jgi:hypothetical protein